MTANDVSVGLTYEVLVSDKLVPVLLNRVCDWGGWYGTNLSTGNAVRIKTAGRLRKQLDGEKARTDEARKQELTANIVHTQTQEATVPTTTETTRAKRAAKRKPAASKETTAVTTPRNANGTIKAKPKAKPTAKKPAAKRQATLKISGAAKQTAKTPDNKPVVVKLKIERITDTKVQFNYAGTAAEPFIKALWITKEALTEMGEGEITVHFGHYEPTGKQKPMPASAIRYRGTSDAITDLYVNRAQAEKAGFTEASKVGMGISALTEDTIQVTIVG